MIIPPKKVLRCLYSSQLTKKKKTWFDGQAKLDEKTGTLYLHKVSWLALVRFITVQIFYSGTRRSVLRFLGVDMYKIFLNSNFLTLTLEMG